MTRILVISDSHGAAMRLGMIPDFCASEMINAVWHLGDITDDARLLQKRLSIPVRFVAGNCDYYSHDPREIIETVEGKRFLLTHGDRWDVKYGEDRLSYHAEECMCQVALFGHTHRPFTGYVGGVLLINPGALKSGSMCVMEVTQKDIIPRIMDIDLWRK